jgi:hypothetical protein
MFSDKSRQAKTPAGRRTLDHRSVRFCAPGWPAFSAPTGNMNFRPRHATAKKTQDSFDSKVVPVCVRGQGRSPGVVILPRRLAASRHHLDTAEVPSNTPSVELLQVLCFLLGECFDLPTWHSNRFGYIYCSVQFVQIPLIPTSPNHTFISSQCRALVFNLIELRSSFFLYTIPIYSNTEDSTLIPIPVITYRL